LAFGIRTSLSDTHQRKKIEVEKKELTDEIDMLEREVQELQGKGNVDSIVTEMEEFDKENKRERETHKAKVTIKNAENEENLRKLEEILTIEIN
jgi:DNA-directed RNA polymerase specialized sigma subunit